MLRSMREAQTSAGVGMARLAYQSAGLRPQTLEVGAAGCDRVRINRSTGQQWTLADLTLHLFNTQRDSADADEAAAFNPDGPSLANYLAGRKMPGLVRIHLAVARMIEDGSLPAEAFQLLHSDPGTHRALDPFWDRLLQVECGRELAPSQAVALREELGWLEAGQNDYDRLLREDRTRFRQSQNSLLDELLTLRAHVSGRQPQSEIGLKKNLRWVLRRAVELASTMNCLRVASIAVTPDFCARAMRTCLRFLPLLDDAGELTFDPYVASFLMTATSEADLMRFHSIRDRVLKRWRTDILPSRCAPRHSVDLKRLLDVARVCDFDDPEFAQQGTRQRDEACIRRCIRWVGAESTYARALLNSISEYYEIDVRSNSDFEEVTHLILEGARHLASESSASVTDAPVKRLIQLVCRLHVDVWTTLNLDVADPVPLDKQPWRSPASVSDAAVQWW